MDYTLRSKPVPALVGLLLLALTLLSPAAAQVSGNVAGICCKTDNCLCASVLGGWQDSALSEPFEA